MGRSGSALRRKRLESGQGYMAVIGAERAVDWLGWSYRDRKAAMWMELPGQRLFSLAVAGVSRPNCSRRVGCILINTPGVR